MQPNPGGVITGDAIVDRAVEIEKIWNALKRQSVVLASERRVGKTSVLRKMKENPKNNWNPVLYWVEGKNHPIEFVEGLYELLIQESLYQGRFHQLKQLYIKYAGGEKIGSWQLPNIRQNWKLLLESLMLDLSNGSENILLMLDELPLMVAKFIQIPNEGPQLGMDFLDMLRSIRNNYEALGKVRFIFCGSIGLNLVIKDLKQNYGYNSDPINNMKMVILQG